MPKIKIGNVRPPLANNTTTTTAGKYALDAVQGKLLNEKIEEAKLMVVDGADISD
ncbi:hypothetical protein [Clostridium sp. AF24-2LB]|jgi:hypothetical protein|uniref:hypothetical protein n=1 Tax=unclassified Clostridium TaxID=2614128 RepID=UPI0015FD6BD8|nr:hypothetical protein [Clostridium sp. AF24-2LB]